MVSRIGRGSLFSNVLRKYNLCFNRNIVDDLERPPRPTLYLDDIHKLPYEDANPFREEPPPEKYTDVEVSTAEWKFVERLIPPLVIPKPPTAKGQPFPSGWEPPAETPPDLPYFVRRTRNYMMPVYLKVTDGGTRPLTLIKGVLGNVWELEKQLRAIAELKAGHPVMSSVDEPGQRIILKGDYVQDVKRWLERTGF